MNDHYNLHSILDAIDDINNKSKKKNIAPNLIRSQKINVSKNLIKLQKININTEEEILPITEKIILEAEEQSNRSKDNSLILTATNDDVLLLNEEYNDQNLEFVNLEKIKLRIIDDLYSQLSQKVKKNTLKIIFDLNQKIIFLEKKINNLNININGEVPDYIDIKNMKRKENKEHLINEDSENEEHFINKENNDVTIATIETLKLQASLIKNFEKNEKKLRLKIVDLEQDVSILTARKDIVTNNVSLNQNKFIKTDSKIIKESIFFRENYERSINDNNELKKKLSISQERINVFEKNIKELETSFENLKNILSKNSIIKQ